MKTNFILTLVVSIIFHDCRASILENQILHPFDNGYLQKFLNNYYNFLPRSSLFVRTSKSGATDQNEPSNNIDRAPWHESLYGKDPLQTVLGGITGWFAGFIAMKVGKLAATAIAGGALLVAIANYNDLISINWDQVNSNVNNVSTSFHPESQSWGYKVASFVNENRYTAAGFGIGFIVGILTA